MSDEKPRILVVGDVMLDVSIHGHSSRLAPEGPIPVVLRSFSTSSPGGAANTAMNAAALGADVTLIGIVDPEDSHTRDLFCQLSQAGVRFLSIDGEMTTVKTRVYADEHLVARYDKEKFQTNPEVVGDRFEFALRQCSPHVVVLSDYGKGTLAGVCHSLINSAHDKPGRLVLVDPKGTDFTLYAGADLIKPNLSEAFHGDPPAEFKQEDIYRRAMQICEAFAVSSVLITCGLNGMLWADGKTGDMCYRPAFRPQEVFDLTGAGDTTLAAVAVKLAERCTGNEEVLDFAACAAGIVVGKPGTAVVTREEVDAALNHKHDPTEHKILATLDDVKKWAERHHADDNHKTIAFTNGCFDLLHPGHLFSLRYARSNHDELIVAINSDESVARLKCHPRPYIPQRQRALLLAALEYVSAVFIFDGDDPTPVIEAVCPDTLVKGAEYQDKAVAGAEFVKSYGGKVKFAHSQPDWSTTKLVERIKHPPLVEEVS